MAWVVAVVARCDFVVSISTCHTSKVLRVPVVECRYGTYVVVVQPQVFNNSIRLFEFKKARYTRRINIKVLNIKARKIKASPILNNVIAWITNVTNTNKDVPIKKLIRADSLPMYIELFVIVFDF